MGAGGDVYEVPPRAGLAARQMHLEDAKACRLAEDASPSRGVEFVLSRIERERVRAIGAAERTAVGQLGEQAERLVAYCRTRSRPTTIDPILCPAFVIFNGTAQQTVYNNHLWPIKFVGI